MLGHRWLLYRSACCWSFSRRSTHFFFPRQASDYHWKFSRLYAAGIVHWVKAFLTCKWQSLPRTGKTLRHHIEQTVPQLLAQMKKNTTELCSFRFEHRIKTHSPVNQVVLDMHRQGMFSVSGLSHLLSGYLEGGGIRLRVLPVVEVLQNLETLLGRVRGWSVRGPPGIFFIFSQNSTYASVFKVLQWQHGLMGHCCARCVRRLKAVIKSLSQQFLGNPFIPSHSPVCCEHFCSHNHQDRSI
jgi:hypothetical protein